MRLKQWVVIAAITGTTAVIVWSSQPNQTAQKQHSEAPKETAPSLAYDNSDRSIDTNEKPEKQPPSFYAPLENPEWWLAFIALLTLGFIGWQAFETRRSVQKAAASVAAIHRQAEVMEDQVTEMKEQRGVMQGQLDTMKGQLELEHRPWISVKVEPTSPLIFDKQGCTLVCKFTLTNVGHSVAKHVSLWTDFALLGLDNPAEVRNKLCDIMKGPQNQNSDYGWLLFPDQDTKEHRPIIAISERIEKALEKKTFQGLNAIGLHLVGCVDYPSLTDPKKRHQTRFEYIVSFVMPTSGVMGAFDPIKGPYQPIILTPTLHGASAD
jgi:hypothetical protein